MRPAIWLSGILTSLALTTPALAIDQFNREQDIVNLRLGQRVQVDDGSCPTGQIKEIQGTTLTTNGVARVKKCVPRSGTKTR
jgi:hypothetical protein